MLPPSWVLWLTMLHVCVYWCASTCSPSPKVPRPQGMRWREVLRNQVTVLPCMLWLLLPAPSMETDMAAALTAIPEVVLCLLVYDPLFFVLHRAMHIVRGGAWHRVHHEASLRPAHALLMHPVDFAVSGITPILLPMLFCSSSGTPQALTYIFLVAFSTAHTVLSHRPADASNKHGVHHVFTNRNFGGGPLFLLDRLCGTYRQPQPKFIPPPAVVPMSAV